MVILERIQQLMTERGLSKKKLAKASGLSDSTISNLFKRHNDPSFATLKAICDGLGITLMQFFAEDGEAVVLTQEQQKLFAAWNFLSAKQRRLMLEFVDTFQEEIGKAAKNEL
jgi:transcriptional regulator with XRE-family HTH domain